MTSLSAKKIHFEISFEHCQERLFWIFRFAVAMCFVGHGAFGLITKSSWLAYFDVVSIPEAWAWKLMPIVGTVDIAVGLWMLIQPNRIVLAYMAFWGFWTAALRPLAGESSAELIERAGNYGIPLAFLWWAGIQKIFRDPWRPIALNELPDPPSDIVMKILRTTVSLLLIGHGALFLEEKPLLITHWESMGMAAWPIEASHFMYGLGIFEIVLGLVALGIRRPSFFLFVCVWKIFSELLFPHTYAPFWEFVERGGSYAAPLVLLVLLSRKPFGHPTSGVLITKEAL